MTDTPDPTPPCDHCGHGVWFDRTICPDPCGAMHERCINCGSAVSLCVHESDVAVTNAHAARMLNVSIRFVDSLVLSGEIELTVGSVMAYRDRDDAERAKAADELTRLGQEIEAACDHALPPMGDLTPNAVACEKCVFRRGNPVPEE